MAGRIFIGLGFIVSPSIAGVIYLMEGKYFGLVFFIVPIFTILLFSNSVPSDAGRNYIKNSNKPLYPKIELPPGTITEQEALKQRQIESQKKTTPDKETRTEKDAVYIPLGDVYSNVGKTGYQDLDQEEQDAKISFLSRLLNTSIERRTRNEKISKEKKKEPEPDFIPDTKSMRTIQKATDIVAKKTDAEKKKAKEEFEKKQKEIEERKKKKGGGFWSL